MSLYWWYVHEYRILTISGNSFQQVAEGTKHLPHLWDLCSNEIAVRSSKHILKVQNLSSFFSCYYVVIRAILWNILVAYSPDKSRNIEAFFEFTTFTANYLVQALHPSVIIILNPSCINEAIHVIYP